MGYIKLSVNNKINYCGFETAGGHPFENRGIFVLRTHTDSVAKMESITGNQGATWYRRVNAAC